MIAASLLLILVAVVLLGTGLARGSDALLIGSIAASLLAAITLVVGARQVAADRVDEPEEFDDGPATNHGEDRHDPVHQGAAAPTEQLTEPLPVTADRPAVDGPAAATAAVDGPAAATAAVDGPTADIPAQLDEPADDADDEDPPDEPAPQQVPPGDADQVARLSTEVLVVDGRPRYHLADCPHLRDRESETLPVSEAVELGFTPCGLCQPVGALLAAVRRG